MGPQVVLEDGTYPGGRLTVQPLPAQVYGEGNLRTLSLRRVEAIVSEADAQDHIDQELLKVIAAFTLHACPSCSTDRMSEQDLKDVAPMLPKYAETH